MVASVQLDLVSSVVCLRLCLRKSGGIRSRENVTGMKRQRIKDKGEGAASCATKSEKIANVLGDAVCRRYNGRGW
jgi:hypothetical protein